MSNAPDSLATLRREIDSIDEDMHDLLMRRAEIVVEIGRAKADEGGPTFRPAREAQLLRRLLARHSGALSGDVVVRIWREIIAASIRLQGDFVVGLCPVEGDAETLDLAHAQFGLDAEVRHYGSPAQVALAVGRGDAQAGLVPLANAGDGADWWAGSDLPGDVHVVARVPWTLPASSVGAYILSNTAPEESGDDRSVFVIGSDTTVSRGRLSELASANGLDVGEQAAAPVDGGIVHLLDVAGFVSADDPRVRGVATLLDDASVRRLGAYASPWAGPAGSETE
ncbi:MAG: chorismate mutase [Alphaproteobacteria bacterium]|nr:chorismate mutase [Alphaproteobacteria bacterium]